MTTQATTPPGASLHLGGDAYASPDLEPLLTPITSVTGWPGNPRRHDQDGITASIRDHGLYQGIVVQASTNRVLVGHGRLQALTDLGATRVPVTLMDVDDARGAAIVARDNRTSDLSTNDDALLLDLLAPLADDGDLLALAGYAAEDLAALRAIVDEDQDPEAENDVDDVPPVPQADPISQAGDVWVLGPHRLAVGDSTDPGVMRRLLGPDVEVDLIFTDPPYGVDYQGRTGVPIPSGGHTWTKKDHDAYSKSRRQDGLKVANDALGEDGTRALVGDALRVAPLKRGGVFYVCAPPGDMEMAFRLGLIDAGLPMRHSIVWVKDQFTFGRSDYHYRHESILYGWRKDAAHYFVKDRTQDSVWEVPRPRRSPEHPTMKPVELVARALRNSSRSGDLVLDPFGGSGTTLIAAHTEGRIARLIEIDPRYADVICRRYQEHTGTLPVRNGAQVSFTRAA